MTHLNFSLIEKIFSLLKLFILNPTLTIKLISWKRLKNTFRVIFLNQGNIGQLLQRYGTIYNTTSTSINISDANSKKYVGNVIFFPPIDWEFRFQRPQHLAVQLALNGQRVFYISIVPLLMAGESRYHIYDCPSPGVFLVKLFSNSFRIPDLYQDEISEDELAGFLKSYAAFKNDLVIEFPNIVIQHPFWWSVVSNLKPRKVIYDCLDDHSGFHHHPNESLQKLEVDLVKKADEVIVTSERLSDSFRLIRECHVVRNGCEFNRFKEIPRLKSKIVPIIGYVGAVAEWFDGELLYEIARIRPDWKFEIYGATVGANISSARSLSNVFFYGEIPYESVPSTLARFDVCIIPFKLNPLTLATNPVKVYEYLAAGRPTVSTALPELTILESLDIFCANSYDEFIRKIEHSILISDIADRIKLRQDWASNNDWSMRAIDLLVLLDA